MFFNKNKENFVSFGERCNYDPETIELHAKFLMCLAETEELRKNGEPRIAYGTRIFIPDEEVGNYGNYATFIP